MTDRPIIFSAPMIRALLEGRKTMTRRVLKPQPAPEITGCGRFADSRVGLKDEWEWLTGDPTDIDEVSAAGSFKTRYLEGDRLWVREAWRTFVSLDDVAPVDLLTPERGAGICYEAGGGASISRPPAREFFSDYSLEERHDRNAFGRLRASMHMPRAFSRLTLNVTDVHVQRLQDISEDDAVAEGATKRAASYGFRSRDEGWSMDWSEVGGLSRFGSGEQVGKSKRLTESDVSLSDARSAFGSFINHLHGGKNWNLKPTNLWAANPWVAAISFTVARRNIDTTPQG